MSTVTANMVKELREITGAGMMECKKALVESNGDMDLAIDNMRKSGQAKAAKRAGKIAAEGVIMVALSNDQKCAAMLELNCETDFVARDEGFKGFATLLTDTALQSQANDIAVLMAQVPAGQKDSCETLREQLVLKIGENISPRRVVTVTSEGCVNCYIHSDRIGVVVALDKHNPELAKDIAMHIAATNPYAIDGSGLSKEVLDKEREIVTAQSADSGKPANIIEKMVEGRLQKFVKEVCLIYQPFVKNPDETVEGLLKAAGAKVISFVRFAVGEGIEKQTTDFAKEVAETIKGV